MMTRNFERGGRPGGDKRGSAASRRKRKAWLLATYGDGVTCTCTHCPTVLDFATIEADRIIPGGSYRRDNIQPACRACNLARSNNVNWSNGK
jgi:hypothetical protein